MNTKTKERGLLEGAFKSQFWNTRITSANVKKTERLLGYVAGPFGVMLLQSIVNSYFAQLHLLAYLVAKVYTEHISCIAPAKIIPRL